MLSKLETLSWNKQNDYDTRYTKLKLNQRNKNESILKSVSQKSPKDFETVFGAKQYLAKLLRKKSNETMTLRKVLKRTNYRGEKTNRKKIKYVVDRETLFTHNVNGKENMVTPVASKSGLGITLWQKQDIGSNKTIAYNRRYLNDTEKICSAVVWEKAISSFIFR